MHDGTVVILSSKMPAIFTFFEIFPLFLSNIVLNNFDELVTIRSVVVMVKTHQMTYFMANISRRTMTAQNQLLPSSSHANIAFATYYCVPCRPCNVDIIHFIGSGSEKFMRQFSNTKTSCKTIKDAVQFEYFVSFSGIPM